MSRQIRKYDESKSQSAINTRTPTARKWKYGLLILIFVVLPTMLFTACVKQAVGEASKSSASEYRFQRKFLLGVGFWPTDYSQGYIDANFRELMEAAEIAYIQPEWTVESNRALSRIFDSWAERAKKEGLRTYIAIECLTGDRQGIRNPGGNPNITFADSSFRRRYLEHVLKTVKKHHPEYLNIGVELNMYLRTHPADTKNFKSLYKQIYSEVKKVSPRTKVFVSFQYEVLRGNSFGTKVQPQWRLLKEFEPLQDVLGISSYPRFLASPYNPSKVPTNYYSDLKSYNSRPIFFAEIGWYSSGNVSPPSSESKQADFIRKLPALLEPLNVEAVNWVGIRDPMDIPPLAELKKLVPQFFSLGLLKSKGGNKSAWSAWKGLKAGRSSKSEVREAAVPPPKQQVPAPGRALVYLSFDRGTESFFGIGSSKDLRVTRDAGKVKGGKGALQWKYKISNNPLPMLLRQKIDIRGGAKLSFWLKSRQPTQVAVILLDEKGARFEHRLSINNTDWNNYNIGFGEFTNPQGGGAMNPAKIKKMAFIDIYGFAGGKGDNTIYLDELRIE